MVEPRIYCAVCVTREDLNKSADWPESIIAVFWADYYWTLHIMHRQVLFTQNHSMNEKLVVLNFIVFLTNNYVIVLSSVLFGYGTVICINTIDIIL